MELCVHKRQRFTNNKSPIHSESGFFIGGMTGINTILDFALSDEKAGLITQYF